MRSEGNERQKIHENDSGQPATAMQRNGENHKGGQKDREVTSMIQRMIEGDNFERFVVSIEKSLTQEDIPYDQWKTALLSNLTQKARDMVADITDDPDSTFEPIKRQLLESLP